MPHVMAAKALAFKEANTEEFKNYAHQIVKNAKALSEELMKKGIKILTEGTDNHLMVLDVFSSFKINGKQAEAGLRQANLTVNRNSIPNDINGAWFTSGVRIGTPAITTLGMKENEMREIANIIFNVLKNTKAAIDPQTNLPSKNLGEVEPKVLMECRNQVKKLLDKFKLYAEIEI